MKFLTVLGMLGILVIAGCGESEPELYPVEGTVTYQGKTLPLGTIMLVPESRDVKAVVAVIDENGHYKLEAAAGSYSVQIQMNARLRGQPVAEDAAGVDQPEVDWLIPAKYGSFQDSGLKLDVEAGENRSKDFVLK